MSTTESTTNIPGPFQGFKKIPRWSRDIVITEKIDGTNGVLFIDKELNVYPGSKSQWLFPFKGKDNFGFAQWVARNCRDLQSLGPGYHYGEWWGNGINRGYGLPKDDKRFSLFNTSRWKGPGMETKPDWEGKVWKQPLCCLNVPILYEGPMSQERIEYQLIKLAATGSVAVPGFMDPEGIVIFHTAGNLYFKKTIKDDEKPKGSNE